MSEIITKINSKPYRIDFATNRITFLDNRFYVHPNGNYYPSATTILDAYPKNAGFYEWLKKAGDDADNIRDEAGRKGSVIHDLTEQYDMGVEVSLLDDQGNINCRMNEWAQFERYIEFRTRFKPEIIDIEQNLVSDVLGFGGTRDRIIKLNGKKYLLDIKTGNAIYNHFWLQLEAYTQLEYDINKETFDGICILWLNAKTKTDGKKESIQGKGWQLIIEEDKTARAKYWKLFQATHKLWLEENESMQPKNLSYSLTHKF